MSDSEIPANKEATLVEELRARLLAKQDFGLEEIKLNSNNFLARYLRFNGWSVSKAEKMLDYYVKLNNEHEVESLFKRIHEIPKEILYKYYFGGWDFDNRPFFMIPDATSVDLPAILDKGDEEIEKLMFLSMLGHQMGMEKLVLERDSDFGVAIVNLANIKYSQCFHKKTLEFIVRTTRILQKHSPGVTGKIILLNAPRFYRAVLTMAQKLITFQAEVVIFCATDKNWREKLREHVPVDGLIEEFGGTLKESLDIPFLKNMT